MKPADRSSAIIIFMRAPHQNGAKTRLAKTIGRKRATEFYGLCVDAIVSQVNELPSEVNKYIFFAEPVREDKIEYLVDLGYGVAVQEGQDLGCRLQNAFCRVFQEGFRKVVIVASDVPDLTAGIVEEALDGLNSSDVVIGPSHDGGYYLIGMRELHRSIFEGVSWGTEQVCRQTLDAAKQKKLTVRQFKTLTDIDTEDDLRRWFKLGKYKNPAILNFVKAVLL